MFRRFSSISLTRLTPVLTVFVLLLLIVSVKRLYPSSALTGNGKGDPLETGNGIVDFQKQTLESFWNDTAAKNIRIRTLKESLINLLDELDVTIRKEVPENKIYGNIFSGKATQQIESYISAILGFNERYQIKTICEIGFAGGHSATLFLHVTDKSVSYTAFDIWDQPLYEDVAINWVKRQFPDRQITLLKGDARKTVPSFTGSCDLIHIDGAHHAKFPQTDMKNMFRVASANNLLLIDDCTKSWPAVLEGVKYLESNNLVFGIKKFIAEGWSHRGAQKGWCIGRYKKGQSN